MRLRYAIPCAFLWLLGLAGLDGWCLIEFRVADAHLQRALAQTFAAPVSFGNLSLSPAFEVVVTDVRLRRPDQKEKLYGTIDEVRVTPRWADLFTRFEIQVQKIEVVKPTLVVRWNPVDRTFDMPSPLREDLEARTQTMGELPQIDLKGLTLALENPPDVVKPRQNFEFENLSITLAPEGSKRWLYRFEVDCDHPILGKLTGTGRFSGEAFVIEVQRNGLMVTPALLAVVKPEFEEFLKKFSAGGDLTLTAEVAPVGDGKAEAFSATLDCKGMQVQLTDWPQALSNIRGRIAFSQGRLSSEGLTAEFEKAPLAVRGSVDLGGGRKLVDASGEIVGLRISNELASRIRKLPDPCPTVADQIEAWDPDGFANIKFSLMQDRGEDGKPDLLHPTIDVEFKGDTVIRYIGHVGDDGRRHGFAYPLTDLRGNIRFTDLEATFDRLTAMNGTLAVEAHGNINYSRGGDETYDIDVDARGLRLDAKVSDALQGSSRDLFNSLDAEGSADLAIAIKRKRDEPPGPRVDISVDLQGVGINPRQFPLDLADARGRLTIPDDGPIRIARITARRLGGSLSVAGTVPVSRDAGTLGLDVGFERFPVDAVLAAALQHLVPDAAAALAKLNAIGRIDGSLQFATESDGSLKDLKGAIRFDDMTLAPEDPSVRLENVSGSVGLRPSEVTINEGTTATVAGERFAVHGKVLEGGVLDLVIEAENFQVSRKLIAEIEPLVPRIRRLGQTPELTGPMSLRATVQGTPSTPDLGVDLEFNGVDIVLGSISGLRIDDFEGRVSVSPLGAVTVRDLAALVPLPDPSVPRPESSEVVAGASERPRAAMTVKVGDGSYVPPAKDARPGSRGRLDLAACSAAGIEVTPSLIAILPLSADLKERLVKLGLTGAFDLSASSIKWDGFEVRIGRGRLVGQRLAAGADRSILADSISIDRIGVTSSEGVLDVDGSFDVRGARIYGIPVPVMTGRIEADSSGIGFESIDADLLGYYEARQGQRIPLGKINPEDSRVGIEYDGSFDSRLRVQDVNLPGIIRAFGGNPGQVGGTLRCTVDLQGMLNDVASYGGEGDLSLRARNVVSIPIFYKMFNSLDVLSVFQRTDPWTKVELDFGLQNRVINMAKIRVDSPDVLLDGSGTLNFDGRVKADLKSNQGMGVSPIGWITRTISKAVFSGVRVEGPIKDPRVEAYSVAGR